MEYRNLGRCGLKVSELCLGTMQFGWTADQNTSFQVLAAAYEAGINIIDTADIYSRWVQDNPGGVSETIIGKWLKEAKIDRSSVIIATKVRGRMGDTLNDEGLSRLHIIKAVEDSLRRLQTDFIDLYQAHWFDDLTPIDETLSAFDALVRQGKVRYIGVSNFPAWRLMHALWVSDTMNFIRIDSLQPHYNLVNRAEFERELADACRSFGIGVMPYSPLAGGFLTGKYRRNVTDVGSQRQVARFFTDKNWDLLDKIEQIARDRGGYSISQVALSWLLTQSVVTCPIIGPRDLTQLQDNLGVIGLRLSQEEMNTLNQASDWQNES